jgi:methionyl-tRNA formyltransferase
MRFAMIGIDRSVGVYDAFVAAGWTPVSLITPPADNVIDFNSEIVKRAIALKLPVQMSRLTDNDMKRLAEDGCEALVVCYYPWRIGDWSAHLRHAINFHPSPLPKGRGPYPSITAVADGHTAWGVSCHKIAPGFDEGDVLAQRLFELSPDESYDSINLRTEMAFRLLAADVAKNFDTLWLNAKPQTGGDYWPLFTEQDRTLDWRWPVEQVLRCSRAFGKFGVYADFGGVPIVVRRTVGWQEAHDYRPGKIFKDNPRGLVVAVADGYVGIVEWNAAPARG